MVGAAPSLHWVWLDLDLIYHLGAHCWYAFRDNRINPEPFKRWEDALEWFRTSAPAEPLPETGKSTADLPEPAKGQPFPGVTVHSPEACEGSHCPIHNPSDHHMVAWSMTIRPDRSYLIERICPHGIGHPDPDSLAFFERHGAAHMGIHGCDGCCHTEEEVRNVR